MSQCGFRISKETNAPTSGPKSSTPELLLGNQADASTKPPPQCQTGPRHTNFPPAPHKLPRQAPKQRSGTTAHHRSGHHIGVWLGVAWLALVGAPTATLDSGVA